MDRPWVSHDFMALAHGSPVGHPRLSHASPWHELTI